VAQALNIEPNTSSGTVKARNDLHVKSTLDIITLLYPEPELPFLLNKTSIRTWTLPTTLKKTIQSMLFTL
jgi:hypothetical protein